MDFLELKIVQSRFTEYIVRTQPERRKTMPWRATILPSLSYKTCVLPNCLERKGDRRETG